jgi:hypothetical protein
MILEEIFIKFIIELRRALYKLTSNYGIKLIQSLIFLVLPFKFVIIFFKTPIILQIKVYQPTSTFF